MDPVCLSSVSLEEFHNHTTATNDPARAWMIEQQLKPSALKKEKKERPTKEANEYTKMLSAVESRLELTPQILSGRHRPFDERLLNSEGHII
jgi:hypothetical protein